MNTKIETSMMVFIIRELLKLMGEEATFRENNQTDHKFIHLLKYYKLEQ